MVIAISNWSKPGCKSDSDQMSLSGQYSVFHGIVIKPLLHEAYTVSFAE